MVKKMSLLVACVLMIPRGILQPFIILFVLQSHYTYCLHGNTSAFVKNQMEMLSKMH